MVAPLCCDPELKIEPCIPDEVVPPPTFCEVNASPVARSCVECVPGLFVCPRHFKPCGGEGLMCCFFCWRVLCAKHIYCPCAEAIDRRREVAYCTREGFVAPPPRGSRSAASPVRGPAVPVSPIAAITTTITVPVARVPVEAHRLTITVPASPTTAIVTTTAVSPHVGEDMVSSCLSPGPTYNGPPIDPELALWPLSSLPDWPINDSWRDFAFLPVVFSSRPVDLTSNIQEDNNF